MSDALAKAQNEPNSRNPPASPCPARTCASPLRTANNSTPSPASADELSDSQPAQEPRPRRTRYVRILIPPRRLRHDLHRVRHDRAHGARLVPPDLRPHADDPQG